MTPRELCQLAGTWQRSLPLWAIGEVKADGFRALWLRDRSGKPGLFTRNGMTFLEMEGVPRFQIEAAAGHAPRGTTARHYLHFDPGNAPRLVDALTKLWTAAWAEADLWSAGHCRTIPVRGRPMEIVKRSANSRI